MSRGRRRRLSGNIPRTARRSTRRESRSMSLAAGISVSPPWYPECRYQRFCASFLPVNTIRSVPVTTTRTSATRFGAYVGESFPRRIRAIALATRPTGFPAASMAMVGEFGCAERFAIRLGNKFDNCLRRAVGCALRQAGQSRVAARPVGKARSDFAHKFERRFARQRPADFTDD